MKRNYTILLIAFCLAGVYKAAAQTEVTYYTSMGNFKIMLTDTLTPRTVDSFKARVREHFYDGLIFHRVIKNFVIQGGDPLGNGSGGPGYTIPDEFSPTLKNVPGSLAMANAGPNTNGCQFYINLVNNSGLNNRYTVFGMTTSGFNIVQNIGQVATNANDKPLTDVYIDSIRITGTPTAIKTIAGKLSVSVFPNPSKGKFSIELPEMFTRVELINIDGQLVYQTRAKGLLEIDLSSRPAGFYTVRIANNNGVAAQKLIIQ